MGIYKANKKQKINIDEIFVVFIYTKMFIFIRLSYKLKKDSCNTYLPIWTVLLGIRQAYVWLFLKIPHSIKITVHEIPREKLEFSLLTHEINVLTNWTILAFFVLPKPATSKRDVFTLR